MALIPTTSNDPREASARTEVFVKRRWSQPWVRAYEVVVDSVVFATGFDSSTAQFTRKYGPQEMPFGESDFRAIDPVDWRDWYVKVVIIKGTGEDEQQRTWHGVFTQDADLRRQATTAREGVQTLGAVGLELLLRRSRVTQSRLRGQLTPAAGSAATPQPKEVETYIPRALTFNDDRLSLRAGDEPTKNRHATVKEGKYAFARDAFGAYWSTPQIVQYLLDVASPREYDRPQGTIHIPCRVSRNGDAAWPLTADAAVSVLERPVIECERRNLLDLLAEVLSRKRLYGFRVQVDEIETIDDLPVLELDVFRFNDLDISLPNGGWLRRNNRRKTLADVDTNQIQSLSVRRSNDSKIDATQVRGARRRQVFNLSTQDGTLVKAWTDEEQTKYRTAGSDLEIYGTLTGAERRQLNEAIRSSDALAHVYSKFKLALSEDRYVYNGTGDKGQPQDVYDGGEPYPLGLRLLTRLPMEAPGQTTQQTGIPPVVLLKDVDGNYRHAEKLSTRDELLGKVPQRSWSCQVQVLDTEAAIALKASPNHALGKGQFSALPDDDLEAGDEVDYRNNLIATVAMQLNEYCEVKYANKLPQGSVDSERTLFIDLGDRFFYDTILPGTVVGIENNGLLRHDGGTLRDDRPLLKMLAQQIYDWHAKERQAVDLSFNTIDLTFETGDLLQQIGSGANAIPVHAVVTRLEYRFDRHGSSTQIMTDFAELDLTSLLEPVSAVQHGGRRTA